MSSCQDSSPVPKYTQFSICTVLPSANGCEDTQDHTLEEGGKWVTFCQHREVDGASAVPGGGAVGINCTHGCVYGGEWYDSVPAQSQ